MKPAAILNMQLTIKANGEDSLLDIAVQQYGNVAALFDIALLNELAIDAVPVLGKELIKPVVPETVIAYKTIVNKRKPLPRLIVTAGDEQALVDLAMQECGSVESLFQMAVLNKISVTDDLIIGQQYKKLPVANADIAQVFAGEHKPASNTPVPEDLLPMPLQGVDYWYIEEDFIVS